MSEREEEEREREREREEEEEGGREREKLFLVSFLTKILAFLGISLYHTRLFLVCYSSSKD